MREAKHGVRHYKPTTSTISPSSKSASLIGLSLPSLSPSTQSLGSFGTTACFPRFNLALGSGGVSPAVGYSSARPAFFKNAFTIEPHFVVGRTVRVMSFVVLADRKTILNVSPSTSDSASDPVSFSVDGEGRPSGMCVEGCDAAKFGLFELICGLLLMYSKVALSHATINALNGEW